MSVNREHVCWQRADGTWAIGFWSFYDVGRDNEDWDFEWGVEYQHDEFWWFSEGHTSAEAALAAYQRQNANPGHLSSIHYSPEVTKEIEEYEAVAKKFKTKPKTRRIYLR